MLKIKVVHYETGESHERKLAPKSLSNHKFIIGRYPICDMILSAPEVSRLHASIEYQRGQYYFVDLGSKWGSQINGEEVLADQPFLLKSNDVIRIGDFIILVNEEISLNGDHRIDQPPTENGSQINIAQYYHSLSKKKFELNGDQRINAPPKYVTNLDSIQTNQLIFMVEELEAQGIYQQCASEFWFQGKLLVVSLSLAKSLRQDAIDICQEKLDAGKFCILVEYSAHFTVWEEKSIKEPSRNHFRRI